MIKTVFDPKKQNRAVCYLRMSSERQNARSPDQQYDEIKRRLDAMGYDWPILGVYRDDAISGRFMTKRPGFMQMLCDIETGAKRVDLIVVDTLARFGRAKELEAVRYKLQKEHGVLVVTADTNFADPTTAQGEVHGLISGYMTTASNQERSHNVARGKLDCAEQKHWPGGPVPFGFQLKLMMKTEHGREVVDHSVLVPDPHDRLILPIIFREADTTGFGQNRLARHLNALEQIPNTYKPFAPTSLARWLRDELYVGIYTYGKCATDVVNDARTVRRNPAEKMHRVEGFCEPLVERELFYRVKGHWDARSAKHLEKNQPKQDGKQIAPLSRGLTLKYVLSGLLYCQQCGQRMVCCSTGEYQPKDGPAKRYASYGCPGHRAGSCDNDVHVPEEWLRKAVIKLLSDRLFPE